MKSKIITYNKVSLKISEINILENLSFSINSGEFAYLIGKTGSGKSSIIRSMYYDVQIQSGECTVDGIKINNIKKREIPFLRRKIGIIFQDFKLLSDRSIFKNLEFVLKATDWTNKTKIINRIDEVLEQVKMTDFKNRFPHQLSGGEQQRISIARAILNNPKLILADEPTGNLDPGTSNEIMELLLDINNSGSTILMATHDYNMISKFPHRTLRIENGKLFELSKKT
ncbi:MAG: phosphonate ABC transporter ATP-binding protein [Flavobacteriales bacterium]|nr:phosphonate ABC transporter ATP-binding protein [Flavobacteriales bacterium]|tara:strand:- start:900 stop:1580 length:681 start_codon:yes stop_codon:yes gene_type:complete